MISTLTTFTPNKVIPSLPTILTFLLLFYFLQLQKDIFSNYHFTLISSYLNCINYSSHTIHNCKYKYKYVQDKNQSHFGVRKSSCELVATINPMSFYLM